MFNWFWRNNKRKAHVELSKGITDDVTNEDQKIRRRSKPRKRKSPKVRFNETKKQPENLEERHVATTKETENLTAAIWVKDANEEQIANLRSWVTSQGFTEILEYRDTALLPRHSDIKDIDCESPNNFLIVILGLKSKGVRLISRAEPWIDMSIEDLQMLFLAHCLHDTEADEMSIRSKAAKKQAKKTKKPDDDSTPNTF
jgi:hypothetical protein